MLQKKNELRMIGQQYQRELTEKIKNVKIINLPPAFSPIKRHVEMAFDLGEFFDTTIDLNKKKSR